MNSTAALTERRTAEDIADTILQAAATMSSVVGLAVLIVVALPYGTVSIVSATVYGTTLVLAFAASTLYHSVRNMPVKRVLRIVDHCTIYLLIAGTYTPVALLVLPDNEGRAMAAAVWALACIGIAIRIFGSDRMLKLRVILYLALGWIVVAWGGAIYHGLGTPGTLLLAAGGLTYSVGVIFYLWKKLPFRRAIWHLFVVAGSACFYAAITFYVLPAHAG